MNFSKMMKDPSNNVFGIILLFGVVVLIVILMKYSESKSSNNESMKLRSIGGSMLESSGNMITSADPSQGGFMDVAGIQAAPPMDTQQGIVPSDLLPRDVNSEWSNVNPASNDLKNLNLLSADQVIGINTVSSSLRNANYQERSEPIIPKKDISPWGNSTIQPDTFRRPLEIG
jgi:hypothetical protein